LLQCGGRIFCELKADSVTILGRNPYPFGTIQSYEIKMSHYHGLDWLAMCLTFCVIYLLGNKSRTGFTVMMLGNLLWCVVGFWDRSYAMIIANLGFFTMNVRGFLRWAAPEDTDKQG
jgi:hypothetical protein